MPPAELIDHVRDLIAGWRSCSVVMHHTSAFRSEPRRRPDRADGPRFTSAHGDLGVVGVAEAAAMLDVTRQRIYQYDADGRFVTAQREGGRWRIARVEITWLPT